MSRLDDLRAAMKRYEELQLQSMTVPPLEVLGRAITKADIEAYPVYFITGPGREIAERTECGHGYHLTDSCPVCDSEG
jgi:hypothetical protein